MYDDNVISLCSVSLVLLLVYSVVIIYFNFYRWYYYVDLKKGWNLVINVWIYYFFKFNVSDCNVIFIDEN